jgi:hypothetical protein
MRVSRREIVEPEVLARLGSAFDAAWEAVAHKYVHADVETQAAARAELAIGMLRSADQHADELKGTHQFSGSPSSRLPRCPTPAGTEIAEAVIGASAAANSR